MKDKSIFFVVSRMHGGGAQRVMLNLLNYMADETDWQVTLVLYQSEPGDSYLPLISTNCRTITLGHTAKAGWYKLTRLLRKESPQVLLSTLNYINISAAVSTILSGSKLKLITREARMVSKTHWFVRRVQKLAYWRVDAFWAITPDIEDEMVTMLGIDREKIILAPNPINIPVTFQDLKPTDAQAETIQLLYVGRLIGLKQVELLIKALNLIRDKNWHLKIVGRGPLEDQLKALTSELGLQSKIEFVGYSNDPYAIMSQSDIFCLPSKFEGFPNVLVEALACGNVCISNNTQGGGARYIKDLINTTVIVNYKDPQEVADTIAYYIDNRQILAETKAASAQLAQQLQISSYYEKYVKPMIA